RPWFHEAVRTPPTGVRFTLGEGADGREVLQALLLDPAAGPVTLDPQVGAAVREIADVPGESAGADGPGTSTGADGTGEPGAPRAALDGDRLTLHPGAPDAEVSVVTLPRRG